jgi:hypothetical protein
VTLELAGVVRHADPGTKDESRSHGQGHVDVKVHQASDREFTEKPLSGALAIGV